MMKLVDQSATLQGCALLFLLSFRGRVALGHLKNLLRGWPSPCAARRLRHAPRESRQRRDPLFGPNHEEERVVFCEVSTNLALEILHAIAFPFFAV